MAVTVAQGETGDALYALASLATLLWALWLLAVAYVFIDPVPEYDASASFFRRSIARLRRAMTTLVSLLMTIMFGVAVVMTIRTISLLVA